VLLASIGAVALMLLTGYAGQISLGHAGLLAAGAFTTGILFKEFGASMWLTCPPPPRSRRARPDFRLPSLRLRGLYLAVSTLALHFIVTFAGGEYETRRGFSTGIVIESPLADARHWYFVLLAAAAATLLFGLNLLRSRTGRAGAGARCREVRPTTSHHVHRAPSAPGPRAQQVEAEQQRCGRRCEQDEIPVARIGERRFDDDAGGKPRGSRIRRRRR